ncbi:unnamed protein product [Orchesella dallaii]|uniref:Doublecortin domain-containing protein n=1 Tax=Orchesella dallaii TaxID=48710 RepID=A0ABP1PMR6_9HEXA
MSYRAPAIFPEPTWRLCHPVNIYVYKNGVPAEKAQLVHIPMEKKKNMSTVLEAIGARMKLPVGYPIALYNMDGTRVCKTYELEMYNNYVVVTNLEKSFKCVEYGKVREPLVVIGHHSKHVNTLKFQNKKFDLFCRRKMARKPLHELAVNADIPDGLTPAEITTGGKPCGILCHKIQPSRTKPTQVCSDEIMCVEGAAMDQEQDYCRQADNLRVHPNGQISPLCQEEELEELARQVREETQCRGSQSAHLVDLIHRYKDVGSDIFKMFQDRINQVTNTDSNVSSRWNIPTHLDNQTQQKLKDEWLRLTNAPCDFTFDEHGNFLYSSGCRIGPPDEVGSSSKNNSPHKSASLTGPDGQNVATSVEDAMKSGKLPTDIRLSFLQMLEKQSLQQNNVQRQGRSSKDQTNQLNRKEDADELSDEKNRMLEAMRNSITESANLQKERLSQSSNRPAGPGGDDPTGEKIEFGKPPSDQEINEIIRHMSTALMSGANLDGTAGQANGGGGGGSRKTSFDASLPPIPEQSGEDSRNSNGAFSVENEDEGTYRRESLKSNTTNKDDGQKQVYKVMVENSNRNPFRNESIGRLPFSGGKTESLVGKLSSDRINSLISQNPFRKCFLYGDKKGVRDEMFSSSMGPPDSQDPDSKKRNNKVSFVEDDVDNNNVNEYQPSVTFRIPESNRSSDIFPNSSVVGGSNRRKYCPGFLTQINELVHRLDNSKATSPPPPSAPPQNGIEVSDKISSSTFTLERRRDNLMDSDDERPQPQVRSMHQREVACGSSTLFKVAKTRNVCAQAGPSNLNGRSNDGGTQTMEASQTKMMRDEDVEPAGIYEGYQETFKARNLIDYSSDSSDNSELAYNKNRYARRRQIRHGRNKEYRHHEERKERDSRAERGRDLYPPSARYQNNLNQNSDMGYAGVQPQPSESPRGNPNASPFTRTINISTGGSPPSIHIPAHQQQQRLQQQHQQLNQPVYQRFVVNHNQPSRNLGAVQNPAQTMPQTNQQAPPPVPPRLSQLPQNPGQFFVQTSPTTGPPHQLTAGHQTQAQQQPVILRMQNFGNGSGVVLPPGVQMMQNMGPGQQQQFLQGPSNQMGQPILLASQQQPQQIQNRFGVNQPTVSGVVMASGGAASNIVGLTRMHMPTNNGMVPFLIRNQNGSVLQTNGGQAQTVQLVQNGTINGGGGTLLRPLQNGSYVLLNNGMFSSSNQQIQTNKYVSMSPYPLNSTQQILRQNK